MIYAMMSIGVLGFVVWSQWLAFPLGDYGVINSTVGWNGFLFLFLFIYIIKNTELGNLLDTFYSLNANKNAQSAGNLLEGSSETIRGNTYDLFKINFYHYFNKKFSKDNTWLSWFIGFLEGDGAILEHKGRCLFVVTQKDNGILHEIQETLKFGIVKDFYDDKGNRKFSRYVVSGHKYIYLLYLLLNSNLVLDSRVKQLSKWNIALKNASQFNWSLFHTSILPKLVVKIKEPSVNDAWLSGFTDAEGCFSIKIANAKGLFYVSVLFILDQKNEQDALDKIGTIFSENRKAKLRTPNVKHSLKDNTHKPLNNMFRLTFYCDDKKKNTSYKILDYFNTYKLKTTKKNSFCIWSEILYIVLGKQPLSTENLDKVRKLRHNMNYYTIKNKPIGIANKS
jgi:hypothetical protein